MDAATRGCDACKFDVVFVVLLFICRDIPERVAALRSLLLLLLRDAHTRTSSLLL